MSSDAGFYFTYNLIHLHHDLQPLVEKVSVNFKGPLEADGGWGPVARGVAGKNECWHCSPTCAYSLTLYTVITFLRVSMFSFIYISKVKIVVFPIARHPLACVVFMRFVIVSLGGTLTVEIGVFRTKEIKTNWIKIIPKDDQEIISNYYQGFLNNVN